MDTEEDAHVVILLPGFLCPRLDLAFHAYVTEAGGALFVHEFFSWCLSHI
jgi:hypothetical protein